MVNSRLRDPGFKIRDRDLAFVLIPSRRLNFKKISSPETLSAKNLRWWKSVKLTKMTKNVNESWRKPTNLLLSHALLS